MDFLLSRLIGYVRQSERWPPDLIPSSDQLNRIISRYEERYGFRLTAYARQMLIIPIEERIREGDRIDWRDVDESINKLFDSIREDESEP
jgi:hypothetical protein